MGWDKPLSLTPLATTAIGIDECDITASPLAATPIDIDECDNKASSVAELPSFLTEGDSELCDTSATFSFQDVNCSVACSIKDGNSSKNDGLKRILTNATGHGEGGELLAILGASGAGKSTLLDILSGRKTVGKIQGELFLNGETINSGVVKQLSGYVAQEDVLTPTLTVRETLHFVADLQIPESVCQNSAQRCARVQTVLTALHLESCADTKVGGYLMQGRGISGGEKRRVSIGMEFLTSPKILFMDEPTSGLDSASALSLFNTLQTLALVLAWPA
jgi:ABC-type multidrug transport system ATPase subunit